MQKFCHGQEAVDQEQDAASREELLGGRHLRHVEAGRARTFHASLLSTAAHSRGRVHLFGYPRGARSRSQTPCPGRRSIMPLTIAPATAIAPPAAREPRPPRRDLERRRERDREGRRRQHDETAEEQRASHRTGTLASGTTTPAGSRAIAARAATIDHRMLGTQAPSSRSPAPVRVHGPIVATTARTAPATVAHDPVKEADGLRRNDERGSPSSTARHSGPITRPRTGTAHVRQIGSSQAAHRATAALPG